MKAPLDRMSKSEIVKLHNWRCKHGHTGIVHYNCWLESMGRPERVAFVDIETSNLNADFGMILSWAIKDGATGKVIHDVITKKDLTSGVMDKRVVKSCIAAIKLFDRVVGHYSSRFDFPYLRSRALRWNLPFPRYGDILQTDTWKMARSVLKIHSNRQDSVAYLLHGHTVKTRLEPRHWMSGMMGDAKGLRYILDHNIQDVEELYKNYKKLEQFTKKSASSI